LGCLFPKGDFLIIKFGALNYGEISDDLFLNSYWSFPSVERTYKEFFFWFFNFSRWFFLSYSNIHRRSWSKTDLEKSDFFVKWDLIVWASEIASVFF